MTQFQPPPDAPDAMPPGAPTPGQPEARWSATAIAGFVLSILGCTGIGAVLGISLGVVGIVVTRGGKRRGAGLAIAAIPISLVTGVISLFILYTLAMYAAMGAIKAKMPELLDANASGFANGAAVIRKFGTDNFQENVTVEVLESWLAKVAEKHGRLVELDAKPQAAPQPTEQGFSIGYGGKFVNGRAAVSFVYTQTALLELRIDDIQVDGLSPRDVD